MLPDPKLTDTRAFDACKHAVVTLFDTYKGIEISRCEACQWYTVASEGMWFSPGWEAVPCAG